MRKVMVVGFMFLLMLGIYGCTENQPTAVQLNYHGEGEHWTADYQIIPKEQFPNEYEDKFILKNRDSKARFEEVVCNYETTAGSKPNQIRSTYTEGGLVITGGRSGDIQSAKEGLRVVVEWNGQKEEIVMEQTK